MQHFENLYESGCNLMVVGDFHARVTERPDIIEHETVFIDHLLPEGYIQDDVLYRKS